MGGSCSWGWWLKLDPDLGLPASVAPLHKHMLSFDEVFLQTDWLVRSTVWQGRAVPAPAGLLYHGTVHPTKHRQIATSYGLQDQSYIHPASKSMGAREQPDKNNLLSLIHFMLWPQKRRRDQTVRETASKCVSHVRRKPAEFLGPGLLFKCDQWFGPV